jgi:O-antigen/teichoic acid export membrane protein
VLITLALIPAFYAALSDSLLEIVPKLHQTIFPLQKNQVAVGVGRLILTALTMFVFPWAFIGILAAGIPRIFGNIHLRKISYDFADKDQKPDKVVRLEILALVKKIMPTSIYYCVSGQITIWLISIFGNTTSLAQLGALGRLGVILSVLSTIIITLIVPRFAKLAIKKELLLKRFVQILGLIVVFLSIIIFIVYTFPNPILWLLGDTYKGLSFELLLSIIGSCIGLLSGIVFQLYSSRGWAMSPFLMISLNLLAIIGLASILDLSNLQGVLYFEIWLSTIIFVQLSLFSLYKIIKL